jgi:hypothetical protein
VLISGFVSLTSISIGATPGTPNFLDRLGTMGRLIRFDKRGTGMSDRPQGVPDLETRMHDVLAVMDAAGSERAVLFGVVEDVLPDAIVLLDVDRFQATPGDPRDFGDGVVDPDHAAMRRSKDSRHGFSTGAAAAPGLSHVHGGDTAPRNNQGRDSGRGRRDRGDRNTGDQRNDPECQSRILLGWRTGALTRPRGEPFGHCRINARLCLPVEPGDEAVQHRVLVVRAELAARSDGGRHVGAGEPWVLGHPARIEPRRLARRRRLPQN